MNNIIEFNKKLNVVKELGIFDIVRVVDVEDRMEYFISEDGNLVSNKKQCFAVWERSGKCENCISAKACTIQGRCSKFEVRGNDIYQIIAQYVELNGKGYAVEYVVKEDNATVVDAHGKELFISTIIETNKKLYLDPLTGAQNRLYYEEQVKNTRINGLAMIDIDNFKSINDAFGHQKGDEALKSITEIIKKYIRIQDSVIRMGGDEFLLVFKSIPKETFISRLKEIVKVVEQSTQFTISIGGYYTNACDVKATLRADELLYIAKQTKNTAVVL